MCNKQYFKIDYKCCFVYLFLVSVGAGERAAILLDCGFLFGGGVLLFLVVFVVWGFLFRNHAHLELDHDLKCDKYVSIRY